MDGIGKTPALSNTAAISQPKVVRTPEVSDQDFSPATASDTADISAKHGCGNPDKLEKQVQSDLKYAFDLTKNYDGKHDKVYDFCEKSVSEKKNGWIARNLLGKPATENVESYKSLGPGGAFLNLKKDESVYAYPMRWEERYEYEESYGNIYKTRDLPPALVGDGGRQIVELNGFQEFRDFFDTTYKK